MRAAGRPRSWLLGLKRGSAGERPFRWLLPRGWGSLAWTPITAARLMRAGRGRLLLIVAERHCR
jgi:hypothetical protein